MSGRETRSPFFFCYERLKVSGFVLISHLDKATFKTKESLGPHNLSIA